MKICPVFRLIPCVLLLWTMDLVSSEVRFSILRAANPRPMADMSQMPLTLFDITSLPNEDDETILILLATWGLIYNRRSCEGLL